MITFTSSSTVNNLKKLLGKEIKHLENTAICSIGPVTSETVRQIGFIPEVEAKKHTIDGLIQSVLKHYQT